jgi:hypothetical protein
MDTNVITDNPIAWSRNALGGLRRSNRRSSRVTLIMSPEYAACMHRFHAARDEQLLEFHQTEVDERAWGARVMGSWYFVISHLTERLGRTFGVPSPLLITKY